MRSRFKKRFGRRPHGKEEVELQITSMADILTIMLIFLLKSFSSGAMAIQPSKDINIPMASGDSNYSEAPKVEVSASAIQIEGTLVQNLTNYAPDAKDVLADGSIKAVAEALTSLKKRQETIAKANPDVQLSSELIVISDKRTPYSTIKLIMASGATVGYSDFKMAVIKSD